MIKKLISLIIAVMIVAELIGDKVLAEKVLAEGVYYIESAQKVGHVIDVAGATWFLWVVADLRSLLMTVEGLDGDVHVEDPRQA